jgi:hypothetical protein
MPEVAMDGVMGVLVLTSYRIIFFPASVLVTSCLHSIIDGGNSTGDRDTGTGVVLPLVVGDRAAQSPTADMVNGAADAAGATGFANGSGAVAASEAVVGNGTTNASGGGGGGGGGNSRAGANLSPKRWSFR